MRVALLPAITLEEREAQAKADQLNRLVWITCRVCGMRSKVGLDNPALLCQPCRVDPIMTRGHLLHLRDALRERLWRAGEVWETALAGASEETRARWSRVEQARAAVAAGEVSTAQFAATWRKAKAVTGDFARLLIAWERYEGEAGECNEGLERVEAGLAEVVVYEDAPDEDAHRRALTE